MGWDAGMVVFGNPHLIILWELLIQDLLSLYDVGEL
jgi:hypothetical protein